MGKNVFFGSTTILSLLNSITCSTIAHNTTRHLNVKKTKIFVIVIDNDLRFISIVENT